MRITDVLFTAAGKEFEWFGERRLYPQETELLRGLGSVYGQATVEADFVLWAEEVRGNEIENPVRNYSRVAAARLKTVKAQTEQKEDPRIVEISAFVFDLVNRTPHQDDIKKLLAKYNDQKLIEQSFKTYAEPLDEYERKFAIKNFFRDGGADGIIYSIQKKHAAAVKQAEDTIASIAKGNAAAEESKRKLLESVNMQDEDSEKLKDNPFGE
jgi:hypothetical protein